MRIHRSFAVILVLLVGLVSQSAWAYYDCGWYGPNFEWECIWVPDPSEIEADPSIASNTYYVRSGDMNSDGKRDFFVTGADLYRRVQDFVLLSNGSQYQTVLYLTPSQQSLTTTWPLDSTSVSRVDINLDGFFDFILSEAINGDDIAVITSNEGHTPSGAVVVNDDVRRAAEEIRNAIQYPQETLAQYDSSYTYWFEYWVYYDPCWYIDYTCGYWYPVYYAYTVYGRDSFSSSARSFIDGNRSALQNGSLSASFTAASLLPGEQVILGSGGAVLGSRIGILALRIAITAILIPEAPVIVTGVIVAAAAYGVYSIASAVLTDASPSDIGPNSTTPPPPNDPFEPCQRQPGNEIARTGISDDAARYDLKKNLEARGCAKPNPHAEAHHIVPLRRNPGGTVGNELRAILGRNGININESSNGVWLPKNQNVGSRALAHAEAHSEDVLTEVQRRVLQAETQGGANAIRQELQLIGEQMARGTFLY